MQDIFAALADIARAVTEALSDFLETVRATFERASARRRSLVRRRDARAVVPVDPVWPGKCYADGTPVDCRVTARPYRREYRVRPGDIPDRYGNYPY